MALLKRAPAAPAGLPPLSDDPVVRRLDDALAVLREEHDNVANRLSFFRLQKELEAPELHRDNETSRRRLAQTRQQLKTAQAKLAAQPFPEREPIALDDALPAATCKRCSCGRAISSGSRSAKRKSRSCPQTWP